MSFIKYSISKKFSKEDDATLNVNMHEMEDYNDIQNEMFSQNPRFLKIEHLKISHLLD